MSEHSSIGISVEQLLALRHLPVPSARTLPESNGAWIGAFRSRKRGHGTDYDDLRPYSAGDDVRHIDWRATARIGDLHTRLYREEKEHRVCIVCDLRHCMFTGSQQLRASRALILCARLLWQACHSGTRICLSILTQTGVNALTPGTGAALAIRGCVSLCREYDNALRALKRTGSDTRPAHNNTAHNTTSTRNSTLDTTFDNVLTAAITSEYDKLPIEHPDHAPSLAAMLQWLNTHGEDKSIQLWLSGMDVEGTQFADSLSAANIYSNPVFVHMDDPLLSTSLATGTYYYESPTANVMTLQRALISRRRQKQVHAYLLKTRQSRVERYDSLGIPLLSNVLGDDAVIAQLRHQGYLA